MQGKGIGAQLLFGGLWPFGASEVSSILFLLQGNGFLFKDIPFFLCICFKVQQPGPKSSCPSRVCASSLGAVTPSSSLGSDWQLHSSTCFSRFIGISSSCPTDGFPRPMETKTDNRRANRTPIHKQT